MKTVADTVGVARSNLIAQTAAAAPRRRGRQPQPEAELLAEIKDIIAAVPDLQLSADPCVDAARREQEGGAPVKAKRVYRVMKAHRLLLERHTGNGAAQQHDSRIAVARSEHPLVLRHVRDRL